MSHGPVTPEIQQVVTQGVVLEHHISNSNAAMSALHLQEVASRGDPKAMEVARHRYVAELRLAMGSSAEGLEEEERLQRKCDEAADRIQANLQTDDAIQANLQAAPSEDEMF